MDVGIIEKTENLRALILQNLKRIDGTEQNFQDGTSFVARRPLVAEGIISHNPYSGKLRDGGVLEYWSTGLTEWWSVAKSQIPSTKLQTNLKFQY